MLWLNLPGQRSSTVIEDLKIDLDEAYKSIGKVFSTCKESAIEAECYLCQMDNCPYNTSKKVTPGILSNLVAILMPEELVKFLSHVSLCSDLDIEENASYIRELIYERGEIYYGEDY